MRIQVKRIYDPPADDDGTRVLVDRLWPRGVSKDDAQLDHWARELAPSNDLRRWFDHEPDKYPTFQQRYRDELNDLVDEAVQVLDLAPSDTLTLLTATRDLDIGHANILRECLEELDSQRN